MSYRSKYIIEDKKISAAQYLTEFICERIAEFEGKNLYTKFWNSKEWQKTYRAQITHANKLLKEFDIRQIIKALKCPRGKKIRSLGAKGMIKPLIEPLNEIKTYDENPKKLLLNTKKKRSK